MHADPGWSRQGGEEEARGIHPLPVRRSGSVPILEDQLGEGGEEHRRRPLRSWRHAPQVRGAHVRLQRVPRPRATETDGLYSFVCKNLDNITEAFARCLGGLRTVVAAEIRVDLKPKSSDKQQQQQPVLIKSIDSGGYESQVIGGGTSGKILIPVLYVDEVKKFIVHLKVPKVSATTVNNQQEILTADGDANSVDGKTVRIKEHKLAIRRPREVVDQADLRPAPQVVEQVVVFKLLDMVPKTFQQRREDDHKGVKNTKVAVQLLQRNMDEIRRSDAWTDLDVGTRRRIDEQVKEIADHVEKGEGPAYVNSWVSSQEMQRAKHHGLAQQGGGRVRDAGDEGNSGGGEKATGGEDR